MSRRDVYRAMRNPITPSVIKQRDRDDVARRCAEVLGFSVDLVKELAGWS